MPVPVPLAPMTGTARPLTSPPSGWTLDAEGKTIGIRLKTKDFMQAVDLVNEIAKIAEELEHHPDLHLTGYKNLEVRTYSHDVDRLTERDGRLAERINTLLGSKGIRPT